MLTFISTQGDKFTAISTYIGAGLHKAHYVPTVSGDYSVLVTLDGEMISGSPY